MTVCPSKGFTKVNVTYSRNLGVVELRYGIASKNSLLIPDDTYFDLKNSQAIALLVEIFIFNQAWLHDTMLNTKITKTHHES